MVFGHRKICPRGTDELIIKKIDYITGPWQLHPLIWLWNYATWKSIKEMLLEKTRFSILNGIFVNFPCTPMGGPSGVWDGYIEAGLFSHNTRSCLDWMELGGI